MDPVVSTAGREGVCFSCQRRFFRTLCYLNTLYSKVMKERSCFSQSQLFEGNDANGLQFSQTENTYQIDPQTAMFRKRYVYPRAVLPHPPSPQTCGAADGDCCHQCKEMIY